MSLLERIVYFGSLSLRHCHEQTYLIEVAFGRQQRRLGRDSGRSVLAREAPPTLAAALAAASR
jgi:hypothetical protein